MYPESPTWQRLAVTSSSSTNLPVIGSDSWVRLFYSMSDVTVYLHIVGYHLLNSRDTQYGHKVTCHFLMIRTTIVHLEIAEKW